MAQVTINGITIDPATAAPTVSDRGAEAAQSNYILVQTTGPLTTEQSGQLADLGVEILEYAPESTYICKFAPPDLSPIRALPFVSWVGVYLRDFKVAASLLTGDGPGVASRGAGQPADGSVTVDVVLQKNAMGAEAVDKVATAAGVDASQAQTGASKVRVNIDRSRLPAIAAIDEVRHIEEYVPPVLFNNVARGILGVDAAQTPARLQGEDQTVCVADTGFDIGSTTDVHAAFTGRVKRLYALGRTGADDPDGHGTHVCGSVLADGAMQDGTAIKGTAPCASLVMQSVLDATGGLGGLPTDLHDLFGPPYNDDQARVHSNSWGSRDSNAYTSSSQEVDDFVWNHRDLVICIAAGNSGSDSAGAGVVALGSIRWPATAKNCIAVGASENERPGFTGDSSAYRAYGTAWPVQFPADPINTDQTADNRDGMVAFSSRGPAGGGRIRPDVVAPGSAILSTRSRMATGPGWGPSSDPAYFFEGGTSMATPLVAGCAAVTRQCLMAQGVAAPSAALVKAMLINGASPMTGQYSPPEVGSAPDNNQGFGRINLANTVGPYGAGTSLNYQDETNTLATGQSEQTDQAVVAGTTLNVTLV